MTVAEIAERAGLTERTFFRYFADKREVLFWGAARLQEIPCRRRGRREADSAAPIDAVMAALEAAAAVFQENRENSVRRQADIAANVEQPEREFSIKLAKLASALAGALHRRGVGEPTASLAAEAAITVFRIAFERWINDTSGRDLPLLIRESFDELNTVTAGR